MRYIEAKTILSKLRGRDGLFGIAYNMNLYRGCPHGCIYCDTRSECYGVGDISHVSAKRNAVELLGRELASKKKGTIGTGSMNDPYMPAEKDLRLVRGALELIAAKKFPVHVITKSSLVARDADVLREISKVYAAVSFTVTTANDALARKLEPAASLPAERFSAMERLATEGIYTGVTMMPLLPFITDTEKNVRDILRRAAGAGASYVLAMAGVTLRKGSREYFYGALDRGFPGIRAKYESAFGLRYECWSEDAYRLYGLLGEECARLGLATSIRFYCPPPDGQLELF